MSKIKLQSTTSDHRNIELNAKTSKEDCNIENEKLKRSSIVQESY